MHLDKEIETNVVVENIDLRWSNMYLKQDEGE